MTACPTRVSNRWIVSTLRAGITHALFRRPLSHLAWPNLIGLMCVLMAAMPVSHAFADEVPRDVGYIESFDHGAQAYALRRDGVSVTISILAPLRNGDAITVEDPGATLKIRLIDRPGPLVLTQTSGKTVIAVAPPSHAYLSRVLKLVGGVFDVFDHEERAEVSASIRGTASSVLSVPLLDTPQTLIAGEQSIVIGWLSPSVVAIKILSAANATVAAGKGVGGLWASAPLRLEAGSYRIEVASPTASLTQNLQVVPAGAAPPPPADLGESEVPGDLRETALAVWLAARDPGLRLASLQHVAPLVRSFRPARTLAKALVGGRRPQLPP